MSETSVFWRRFRLLGVLTLIGGAAALGLVGLAYVLHTQPKFFGPPVTIRIAERDSH
ncbi:MAG: hypothetical protein WCF18_08440 [Chthoniobacteraceae bacterium]